MSEEAFPTFQVGAAIGKHRRVKVTDWTTSPPTIGVAAATDEAIGFTNKATFAAGELVSVRLTNQNVTTEVIAAGAFSAGAELFAAADGKVDDVSGSGEFALQLRAMEAATADDDQVTAIPFQGSKVDSASLNELVDDRVGALVVAGVGCTVTYDDGAGTLTISSP